MAESHEGGKATDVTRRAVLTGTTGLALGAMSAAASATKAAAATGSDKAADRDVPAAAKATSVAAAKKIAGAQDPYLRRKQLWVFDLLDTDHDGFVTRHDTMTFAHRLARLTGYTEDSPRAQQAVATVDLIWQEFVALPERVPDPTRLDPEEFVLVSATTLVQMPDMTLQYIGIVTNLAFAMADGDNDGRVTRADWIRLFTKVLGVERERSTRAWEVLDTERRGWLEYPEVLMAVTDFITSADPQAPGNLALDI